MSTTRSWTAFHRRGEVLRAVSEEADLRRDGVLPTHLPGAAAEAVGRDTEQAAGSPSPEPAPQPVPSGSADFVARIKAILAA